MLKPTLPLGALAAPKSWGQQRECCDWPHNGAGHLTSTIIPPATRHRPVTTSK